MDFGFDFPTGPVPPLVTNVNLTAIARSGVGVVATEIEPLVAAASSTAQGVAEVYTIHDIAAEAGMKLVVDLASDVVLSSASIQDGSDLSSANWTRTQVTPTYNVAGTQARMTVNGASPTVSQNVANVQATSTMAPCEISWWFSYESTQWIVILGRASTTVNRCFFDVQNGLLGAADAGMSNASIVAETRNGVAGYRCKVRITSIGSTLTARFTFSTSNTTITNPANGSSVRADDCKATQVRCASIKNRWSGSTLLAAPSVATQPEYEATGLNGHPCLRGYGSQYMLTTEAAAVGALNGNDAEYTLTYVAEVFTPKVLAAIVGAGDPTQASAKSRTIGTSVTSNGRHTNRIIDDVGATANNDTGSDNAAEVLVGEWYTSSSGQVINFKRNGTFVSMQTAAQNVGQVTSTQLALFGRPSSTALSFFSGRIGAVCLAQGTPDGPRDSRNRIDLGGQFGISVAP